MSEYQEPSVLLFHDSLMSRSVCSVFVFREVRCAQASLRGSQPERSESYGLRLGISLLQSEPIQQQPVSSTSATSTPSTTFAPSSICRTSSASSPIGCTLRAQYKRIAAAAPPSTPPQSPQSSSSAAAAAAPPPHTAATSSSTTERSCASTTAAATNLPDRG